jgi:hypothetical protein
MNLALFVQPNEMPPVECQDGALRRRGIDNDGGVILVVLPGFLHSHNIVP